MKTILLITLGLGAAVGLLSLAASDMLASVPPGERERLQKLMSQGNFKDAYEGLRVLALDPKDEPMLVGDDLRRAVQCLVQLGRVGEVDAFREAVVAVQATNWRLIQVAAETYLNEADHSGEVVAGAFERGRHQGDGRAVDASDRDRARALQLLAGGLERLRDEPDRAGVGRYHLTLASALMNGRGGGDSWRLQTLTSLKDLPDYDAPRFPIWGVQAPGAPVEADGTPVYHHLPRSFAEAKSDGERWRWALAQAAEADPAQRDPARMVLAEFLLEQFGTQTAGTFPVPLTTARRPAATCRDSRPSIPSRMRRPSPAWRRAFGASPFLTSSTRSGSTRPWPRNPARLKASRHSSSSQGSLRTAASTTVRSSS